MSEIAETPEEKVLDALIIGALKTPSKKTRKEPGMSDKMNEEVAMTPCPSGGVQFDSHLGLTGTCTTKLQKALALLDEVCSWHRDEESPDYNECDKEPCQFCIEVKNLKKGGGG